MSATKHTPGPWVAEFGSNGAFGIEADRMGITGGLLVLASRNEHPLMAEQMHANARLIAAAPDLLDALLSLLHSADDHSAYMSAVKDARAAVAKATGGAL